MCVCVVLMLVSLLVCMCVRDACFGAMIAPGGDEGIYSRLYVSVVRIMLVIV